MRNTQLVSNSRHFWVLLLGLLIVFTGRVSANECLDLLPYDTAADGLPKICQSDFTGVNKDYSCQDYRSGNSHYRVLYRGGLTPKAVLRLDNQGDVKELVSSPLFGDKRLVCPLKAPAGIPVYASHRGTGVCYDNNDKLVACSVFEHAAARKVHAHRYMTFYTDNPQEPLQIDAQEVGNSEDAMVAELAYQIGMSLWDSECCSAQAIEYLAQAYYLFPRTEAYLKAYRMSRATLAMRELEN